MNKILEYIIIFLVVYFVISVLSFYFPHGTENPYYYPTRGEIVLGSIFIAAFVLFMGNMFNANNRLLGSFQFVFYLSITGLALWIVISIFSLIGRLFPF